MSKLYDTYKNLKLSENGYVYLLCTAKELLLPPALT